MINRCKILEVRTLKYDLIKSIFSKWWYGLIASGKNVQHFSNTAIYLYGKDLSNLKGERRRLFFL